MLRDLLVQLTSYPEPTPTWAIEAASAVAVAFNAQLSAAICQVHIPPISNALADRLIHANETIADENAKSRDRARALIDSFASSVPDTLRGEQYIIDCGPGGIRSGLAERARIHDLTLVPFFQGGEAQGIAENLVFTSGRPVLLLPENGAAGHRFDRIVVGWDGGRAAARAVADALPWLVRASSVSLVVITGEKPVEAQEYLGGLKRHLARHDVMAECVEVPANGVDAGSALLRYCDEAAAELLVMGAFGHSRIRDFVLGGATRTIVVKPPLPVLLSH